MKVLVLQPPGSPPVTLPAGAVVVMRDDGTPFMVAGELTPQLTLFAHAQDADFQHVLQQLGINAIVIVDKLPSR